MKKRETETETETETERLSSETHTAVSYMIERAEFFLILF